MPNFSVLVIDDDGDILLSLKGLLEDEGYKVLLASTGGEGMSKAEGSDVDAVMLDLVLPDVDGLDVLSKMKSSKADLPVINNIRQGDDRSGGQGHEAGRLRLYREAP